MNNFSSKIFTDVMLPYVKAAGEYALRIQKNVGSQPSKEHDNPLGQALTDADISVQNFIEVVLLNHFPEISFFGEEEDKSLNMKYFSQHSGFRALLDPVDGTYSYKIGKEVFSVILSLTSPGGFEAVISYAPGKKTATYFNQEEGVMTENNGVKAKLILQPKSNVIITEKVDDLRERLPEEFSYIDTINDRDAADSILNDTVFYGKAIGFIAENVAAIDWGAYAAMLQKAGGIVTDFRGKPLKFDYSVPNFRYEEILACVDERTHEKILSRI